MVHKPGKAVQHHHQRNAKATVWQHCTSTRKAKNKNKNWQDQMLLRMWSNWNSWASDGSVHFCYHFGKEFGSFFESEIYIYHMTQQFHTWVFIQEKKCIHTRKLERECSLQLYSSQLETGTNPNVQKPWVINKLLFIRIME